MGEALRAKGEALRGEVNRLLWVNAALPPHMAVRLRLTASESKPCGVEAEPRRLIH